EALQESYSNRGPAQGKSGKTNNEEGVSQDRPSSLPAYNPSVSGGMISKRVRKWRRMNLVKKTAIWLHWRLSTELSYRGGETLGEIRREEEEGKQADTDPTRRKTFPVWPSVPLPWLLSFVKAYLEGWLKYRTKEDKEAATAFW
ncbi:hypothetical protein ATANTOWER_009443, partial [Ataeniobius toweri]|nr:hypothetical protein [Ataeniobius toweri]